MRESKSIEKLHFSSTEKLGKKIVIVYLFSSMLCFWFGLVFVMLDGNFWFLWGSEKEIYANKLFKTFLKLNRFFKATSYQMHVTITRSRLSTWGVFFFRVNDMQLLAIFLLHKFSFQSTNLFDKLSF